LDRGEWIATEQGGLLQYTVKITLESPKCISITF